MSYGNNNLADDLAYDLTLFEAPSARRKVSGKKPVNDMHDNKKTSVNEPDTDINSKDTDQREDKKETKKHPFRVIGYGIMGLCAAVAILAMLSGQAKLTELNQKISTANSLLNEKESIYVQNEMRLETELSPETVEYYAGKVLGMTKVDNTKKEFIKLSEGDKAVIAEHNKTTFGEQLFEQFTSLWE